ncbi:UNVERIFIED_CONTAM: hypothetical protein NCL1_11112 [Trichonephila clavipes]
MKIVVYERRSEQTSNLQERKNMIEYVNDQRLNAIERCWKENGKHKSKLYVLVSISGDPAYIRYRHTSHTLGVYRLHFLFASLVICEEECYTSQKLMSVTALYFQGLRNVIFLQDNVRPHAAYSVLIYFDTEGVQLLLWTARSSALFSVENICS